MKEVGVRQTQDLYPLAEGQDYRNSTSSSPGLAVLIEKAGLYLSGFPNLACRSESGHRLNRPTKPTTKPEA